MRNVILTYTIYHKNAQLFLLLFSLLLLFFSHPVSGRNIMRSINSKAAHRYKPFTPAPNSHSAYKKVVNELMSLYKETNPADGFSDDNRYQIKYLVRQAYLTVHLKEGDELPNEYHKDKASYRKFQRSRPYIFFPAQMAPEVPNAYSARVASAADVRATAPSFQQIAASF
jgi:hypothetical protein